MPRRATRLIVGMAALVLPLSAGATASSGPVADRGVAAAPVRRCVVDPTVRARLGALSDLTLARRLFMIHVYGAGATTATALQRKANRALYGVETPAAVIASLQPAGVILIERNSQDPARSRLATSNVGTTRQVTALTAGLRAKGGDPLLLIGIDQEGGRVNRLAPIIGRTPSAAALAASHVATRDVAGQTALMLRSLGINVDFAPDADVVLEGTRPGSVIGDRSFGTSADLVAERVATVVHALQRGGVASIAKHWPGHGSTLTDSHEVTPSLEFSDFAFVDRQLRPFVAARDSEVAGIMVGHLAVPAWDASGLPATLSPAILARLRSGFCGVIVSDSLWMGGVRSHGTDAAVALRALVAGVDLLLMPVDVRAAATRISEAAAADPLVRERLLDAAARVETLRLAYLTV